jgi:RNA polymerase sigma factor (sigma-70 family)
MPLTDSLRDDILASVPSLRAFAISLSGNGDRADDLVQETLLRALANIDSFQPGSNLPAWLFTILRNLFRSDYRKRRRPRSTKQQKMTGGTNASHRLPSRRHFSVGTQPARVRDLALW